MSSRKAIAYFIVGSIIGFAYSFNLFPNLHNEPYYIQYDITPETTKTIYQDLEFELIYEKTSWRWLLGQNYFRLTLSLHNKQEQIRWIDLNVDYFKLQISNGNKAEYSLEKRGLDFYKGNSKIFLAPDGNNSIWFSWNGAFNGRYLKVGTYTVTPIIEIDGEEYSL